MCPRRGGRRNRLRSCFFERSPVRNREYTIHGRDARATGLVAALVVFVGVAVGHARAEVAVGLLFSDPGEEGLERGGLPEAGERVELPVELLVGVGGVELLMAG